VDSAGVRASDRLTQKNYPDSSSAAYVYDLVGKIQQVTDPTGTYAFAYDNMGRLTGTTTNYSFLAGTTFTNAYTYDAASNRTGYTAPDGSTNTYSYDTLNRLTTLANSWAGSFGFSYDSLSRRTQMTRPNGVNTNYSYDSLSRLLSVLHQSGAGTIDGASYTVDAAGNRTAKTGFQAGVTSNYTYDALYELKQVTQATNTTENYTFDPVGNRLSSLTAATMSYNSSNELTATPSTTYTYDANGNTTSKTDSTGTTSYAWDFENRLTSVTLPGTSGTVSFKYDPLGRRIYKSSSFATSVFAYDGDNLIEETTSSGGVVARYSESDEIDEPLAQVRSSATSYYEEDGIGSVTSLSNSAGILTQGYTFDSFGKLTASTGSISNPFQYTAHEFDAETNLSLYRARFYDPSSGRFVSEDPLHFAGGDSNFYSYVGNDPVYYADPFGTDRMCHFPRLCGHDLPPPPPKYLPTNALPPGSVWYTAPGGQTFWIPAGANWCEECKAAKKNGLNPFAVASSVGQGGTYDYQRDPANHVLYNQFQQAANYSVGVYMQCAGYPRWATNAIGLGYGITHSSNYGKDASQWTQAWGQEWDAAKSGKFSNPNCGCI